jgi:hypothetical protein
LGKAARVDADYEEGLLSAEERYERTIAVWQGVRSKIEKLVPESFDKHGSVYDLSLLVLVDLWRRSFRCQV